MRLLKRYGSGTIYDCTEKKRVSPQGLARLVSEGVDVYILDVKTKKEVTAAVLIRTITNIDEELVKKCVSLNAIKNVLQQKEIMTSIYMNKCLRRTKKYKKKTLHSKNKCVQYKDKRDVERVFKFKKTKDYVVLPKGDK